MLKPMKHIQNISNILFSLSRDLSEVAWLKNQSFLWKHSLCKYSCLHSLYLTRCSYWILETIWTKQTAKILKDFRNFGIRREQSKFKFNLHSFHCRNRKCSCNLSSWRLIILEFAYYFAKDSNDNDEELYQRG